MTEREHDLVQHLASMCATAEQLAEIVGWTRTNGRAPGWFWLQLDAARAAYSDDELDPIGGAPDQRISTSLSGASR